MTAMPSPDPAIMKAVERLDYRATVGDVAAQAGLELNLAERGLLALASATGGNLQVAASGDVVYEFPKNFRDILRNKDLRLRLQAWSEKVWRVLFYLIRISFGIVLMLLIAAVFIAIIAVTIAGSFSSDDNNDSRGGDWGSGGFWAFPDFGWVFYSDGQQSQQQDSDLNFLEAVFSFLFGDGNPNAELEEKRWKTIAAVIRQNRGAVVAEQILPFLDVQGSDRDYENDVLPVLTRFDGRPEVSPEGRLVYQFPSLQTTVGRSRQRSIPTFLEESLWEFSQASGGQRFMAGLLGVVLLGGSIWLMLLVSSGALKALAIAALAYSSAFLIIPTVRYFGLQWRNHRIRDRNNARAARAAVLSQLTPALRQKLNYAQQFAVETVIGQEDIVYGTDRDLLDQESEQQDAIDADWQKRLEGRS
jgi:hypothetical protein